MAKRVYAAAVQANERRTAGTRQIDGGHAIRVVDSLDRILGYEKDLNGPMKLATDWPSAEGVTIVDGLSCSTDLLTDVEVIVGYALVWARTKHAIVYEALPLPIWIAVALDPTVAPMRRVALACPLDPGYPNDARPRRGRQKSGVVKVVR